MNKIIKTLMILTSVFVLSGCAINEDVTPGPDQNIQKEDTSKTNEAKVLTEEEIYSLLYDKLGEEDPETGFSYSFYIFGEVVIDDELYYYGRWAWLVEDEEGIPTHSSLISEFFISKDGKKMYTGTYDYEKEKAVLDDGKNLFEE